MKYLLFILLFTISQGLMAESKLIEVHGVSQAYWDVKSGDSLSHIAHHFYPHSSAARHKLTQDILALNPDAFIDNNPDRLRANIRLWLPTGIEAMKKYSDSDKYQVENFLWGQVIKRK